MKIKNRKGEEGGRDDLARIAVIVHGSPCSGSVTPCANGWTCATHLSEYILRAFQFIQEDNVNVDHVMNVMRVGQGAQPVASPERAYAGGGEVHRYVLAAVLAKYFQPHCKQFTFLRTAEFCRSNSNYYWKNWPGRWGEFRGARVRTLEKFTLLMFGIRLAVKYAVESWMSPWIVHQSYQGSAPGCSGVLHQVGRAPLQRYTEVGLRRG